jgi:hypothetical protein
VQADCQYQGLIYKWFQSVHVGHVMTAMSCIATQPWHAGPSVGKYLTSHPLVDAVHLTGSPQTFNAIVWQGQTPVSADGFTHLWPCLQGNCLQEVLQLSRHHILRQCMLIPDRLPK